MAVPVALLQVSVSDDEPVSARVQRVLAWAAEVARTHQVVVLPELWTIGAFATDLVLPAAEPLDGPLCRELARVAAETNTWLFAGSVPERGSNGECYNTQVVFSATGQLAASYRKIHLFGFNGGETTVMTHGDELVVVESPLGPTGLATCYDLRFPEMFRGLVARGAQAFVMPAGWPERRANHWQVLARARAMENQTYVLAANLAGTHAGVPMAGLSAVLDPQGEVLVEAGDDEETLSVEIDLERVTAWRGAFPVLTDRRL
jgi:predicted amidohydrolase